MYYVMIGLQLAIGWQIGVCLFGAVVSHITNMTGSCKGTMNKYKNYFERFKKH